MSEEKRVRPGDIQPADPPQMTSHIIVSMMSRGEAHEDDIDLASVRPNPFAPMLNEDALESMQRGIERRHERPVLVVAELPHGGYVDVDTPHASEAYRRAGSKRVRATIVGKLTDDECREIGLA